MRNIHLNLEELVSYLNQVKPKLKYKDICHFINQQDDIPLCLIRLNVLHEKD